MKKPTDQCRQWTEQECKDAAIMVGKTEAEAVAYYEHFGAVGFEDGCKRPIKNLRLHMQKLKRLNWWPGEGFNKNSIPSIKKLPQHFGKNCGKCGLPARHKTSGSHGDNYFCEAHIYPKTLERYRERGFTRDDGSAL